MIDPANASELAAIAREIGADVLEGALRYPSDTGGWQLGDLDLTECLDRYRGQRLVPIIAPIGEAEPSSYTCGVYGFVMNEVGECPRCKLMVRQGAADVEGGATGRDILDQVDELLRGLDDEGRLDYGG